MKHIGIIPNLFKDKDLKMTFQIASWFNQRGIKPYLAKEIAHKIAAKTVAVAEEELYEFCDGLIVLVFHLLKDQKEILNI